MVNPWDAHRVVKALPHIEKLGKDHLYDKNIQVSSEQFLFMIKNKAFPGSNCYAHAMILRDSDPS